MHFYYKSARKNNYSFTDRLQEADLPCGGFLNSPTDSTDGHGFTMRMMCFYSPTDGTDEHGFGIFKVALTKTTKIQLGDIHEKH